MRQFRDQTLSGSEVDGAELFRVKVDMGAGDLMVCQKVTDALRIEGSFG